MAEIWKPIPEFEDLYEVSNLGRVRFLPRTTRNWRGPVRRKEKIRKLTPSTHGYLYLPLSRDGVSTRIFVHQLVARVFLGENSLGLDVCHNDGDQTNNIPKNLRYDTKKGNMADKKRHGTYTYGELDPHSKLTNKKVREIRSLIGNLSIRAIGRKYGVAHDTIRSVVSGRRWSHVS